MSVCGDVGALFENSLQLHFDVTDIEIEIHGDRRYKLLQRYCRFP